MLEAALLALASIAALSTMTWLVSLLRGDASLVDRVWAIFIAGAGLLYFARLSPHGARGICMTLLVCAWALRLSIFITWRNWGHGEDRRYQQIRARNQPNFWIKSLYLVFWLQTLLAWIVTAPLLVGMAADRPWDWLDFAGCALAAFGIAFESIGDAQMSRFKSDTAHAGQVLDRGLWRFTRHPNYFGEACVWWGLGLMALSGAGLGGAWSMISPALMTLLLLRVSGVPLLEKDIAERRPAYRDYIARTNAFFPGRPRRPPR
jgi:steroid 5-alpha reductase family enzyme